ncbi:uncharacterized protein HKW66_Vig0008270 [Vigna angularis]|uniref:Uncharacterized protein n=1 Tax=Phaseolus angularis TaxID=3914 RepID=A0A8T0LEW2_PHAAN|nr:uncharacterized protein HKW66_Vig0008270 [Vigna angularis]
MLMNTFCNEPETPSGFPITQGFDGWRKMKIQRNGLAMTIWSGGSRAAEAATTDGSPIWSGLAMAIWSGGSRAAEAVMAEAATTEGSPI